jgi:hypothetical protein
MGTAELLAGAGVPLESISLEMPVIEQIACQLADAARVDEKAKFKIVKHCEG